MPNGEIQHTYPALYALSDGVATFPILVQRISQIIDKFGKMRDSASSDLLQIRRELARVEVAYRARLTVYCIRHKTKVW